MMDYRFAKTKGHVPYIFASHVHNLTINDCIVFYPCRCL